jgi:putative MATE family efflux protein
VAHQRPPEPEDHIELEDPGVGEQAVAGAQIRPASCDERGVLRSGRLAGLTMWGAIWVLSWPVLIESFFTALVGMVDTKLAADISVPATDAIGVASYFQWLINIVAIALGVGATAMIARAVGRNRMAAARMTAAQVMLLAIVFGTITGLALSAAAPAIAAMMSLDPGSPAFVHAVDYLRIVSLAVPMQTILFSGVACCRGAGDALSPMLIVAAVNAVNMVVSFLLSGVDLAFASTTPAGDIVRSTVLANPMDLDLGVRGIAWGTAVAWAVGGALMLLRLARGTHGVRLMAKRLRPHPLTIRRLLRVGLPNFAETAGMWFGNFLTVLMVGWMGATGLYGAHVVAIRIEAFSFLPGFAMATAAATLAGQYLGAGRPEFAQCAIRRCLAVAATIMGALGIAFMLFPERIVGAFSSQPLHLQLSPDLIRVCGAAQIPFALAIVVRGALRGAGDTRVVMILTLCSTWLIRLPMAWLFSGVDLPLPGGAHITNPAPLQTWFDIPPLVGLWLALCAEMCLRPLLFEARYIHGGWKRVRV